MSDNIHSETAYKLSIFHVIAMFLQNAKFILKVTGGFMFVALIYSLLATPCYNSYITVLPLNGSPSVRVASYVAFTSFGESGSDVAKTVVGVIKSPAVLDKVIDMKQLLTREQTTGSKHLCFFKSDRKSRSREQIRSDLFDKLTVNSDEGTGLITISVEEKTPDLSVELTKAVFDAAQLVIKSVATSPSSQTSAALEAQLKIAGDELTKAGKELLEYNVKKAEAGKTPVDVRGVLNLQTQMIEKEMELRSAKTFGTKDHPRVKKLQSDYDAIKRELAQAGGLDTESLSQEYEDIADVQGNKQSAIDDTLEYTEKMQEYRAKEASYKALLTQLKQIKATEQDSPFMIHAVGEPTIPEKRTAPQRKKIIFRSGLLGLFCGVLFTLFKGYIEYCRQDAEVAEQINYIISCFTKFKNKK